MVTEEMIKKPIGVTICSVLFAIGGVLSTIVALISLYRLFYGDLFPTTLELYLIVFFFMGGGMLMLIVAWGIRNLMKVARWGGVALAMVGLILWTLVGSYYAFVVYSEDLTADTLAIIISVLLICAYIIVLYFLVINKRVKESFAHRDKYDVKTKISGKMKIIMLGGLFLVIVTHSAVMMYDPASKCETESDDSKRYVCYFYVAGKSNDLTICDKLPECHAKALEPGFDNRCSICLKDMCITRIAFNREDASICDELPSTPVDCTFGSGYIFGGSMHYPSRDECIYVVANKTQDTSLCHRISGQLKDECLNIHEINTLLVNRKV